jgi:tRNA1Val (adenine37-N6)-methyltransferase
VQVGTTGPVGASETLDSICGGKVKVLQRRGGYRFNLDPILLAHFAHTTLKKDMPTIDLGAGAGIISLILARKFRLKSVTGLEFQPTLYSLATRNVALNKCEREVSMVLGDIRRVKNLFPARGFAAVICNPPYQRVGHARVNPEQEKAVARHQLFCTIDDVAKAASHLLTDRGNLYLIYPAARLAQLIASLKKCHLEPRRLRFVHPLEGRRANLVLLEAVKHAGEDVCTEFPLILHEGGDYSPEVEAMIG